MNKPTGSYSSWENTMCNSLAPIGEKTRLAWHDGYASAKTEWQGLTDEEMLDAYAPNRIPDSAYNNMGEDLKKIHDAAKEEMLSGLRAIEAKLKEKNT